MLESIVNWRKKRKKDNFYNIIAENLQPVWYFDRMSYVWKLMPDRLIKVMPDQIGNWIVYDGLRMVSGYMKSRQEAQKFAVLHIADEIISKYYKHFNP